MKTEKQIIIINNETKEIDQEFLLDKPGEKKNILVKAIVEDGGKLKLNGLIHIGKKAIGAEAFLRYQILLLGEKAAAEVIPNLEIENNEVKASHAVSIGQLDEEQLFYLMTRGMTRKEASKLLVEAFKNF